MTAVRKLSYGISELVAAYGVSRATIYRAIARGELQTFKWGARTLVRADEAERFINGRAAA